MSYQENYAVYDGSSNVVGPSSAINNNIAVFDGTSGKLIKDGGATVASKVDVAGDTMTGDLEFSAGSGIITNIITESTTSRTLALTDAFSYIRTTSASSTTITVPLNSSVAFPEGARIEIIQAGAGETSFAAIGGVTINTATGLKISAQYRAATLIKIATNEWDLIGALNA